MKTLQEGINYVMANGQETGPMRTCAGGRFVSSTIKSLDEHGMPQGAQVWNPDGSVYACGVNERMHAIDLTVAPRWEATVVWRLANGFIDTADHKFEEFNELGEFIEGNRDFHTVEEITIRLNPDHLAKMFKKG